MFNTCTIFKRNMNDLPDMIYDEIDDIIYEVIDGQGKVYESNGISTASCNYDPPTVTMKKQVNSPSGCTDEC